MLCSAMRAFDREFLYIGGYFQLGSTTAIDHLVVALFPHKVRDFS